MKPNYLDVLEHVSNNKDFVNHKKWLTENYFKTVSFGDYNKESTYFELFDAYGLNAASEKIAKKKCDEYIKNHPKEKLENGHK